MEEHEGLHIRKEQMVLQGKERDAILEVGIRCPFLSAPIGCKCSNHTIQRAHIVHTFLARLGLARE